MQKPTILSFHPGVLTPFALRLRPEETLQSLKTRAATKVGVPKTQIEPNPQTGDKGFEVKYEWANVWYGLDDEDDFDAFLDRAKSVKEVSISLSHPAIPVTQPPPTPSSLNRPNSDYSPSTYRLGDGFADAGLNAGFSGASVGKVTDDDQSMFSASMPGLNVNSRQRKAEHSIHMISSSATSGKLASSRGSIVDNGSISGTKKARSISGMSGMTAAQQGAVRGIPAHKIAFEKFHNELGVRTFIGSVGPIENVRMMMKPGHRACYMSRSFALAHQFIPKDAAPGFYGFSGITNLGSWPIKVGEKTVEQQVMLVENSYFPIVLGRSFMEKRGVKTDPLDQTSVVFMDTGEIIGCDIVVVKDSNGNPIPVS